jgi:putative SOS response-associated peptidase YedK
VERAAPERRPARDIEVCSFLTTLPNALTQTVNHERSPVILTEDEQFEQWLCGTPAEAFSLVQPFDAERMRIVQEGFEKRYLLAA